MTVEDKIKELTSDIITGLGYSIYDIEYAKEGKNYFLRIYIDNEKGINIEDCERVNNAITDILDQDEYIKEQYFLEVSSPGVERIIRRDEHLDANIDKKIRIKLFRPLDGKKEYVGTLRQYTQDIIIININDNILKIERKNISQIKTVYDWE